MPAARPVDQRMKMERRSERASGSVTASTEAVGLLCRLAPGFQGRRLKVPESSFSISPVWYMRLILDGEKGRN